MNLPATVYIVDDDSAVCNGLSMLLESADLNVKTFSSSAEFLAFTPPANAIACIILDVRMPQMSGPELQTELLKRNIDLPILFLSGYGDIPLAVETIKAGAVDFLTKPVSAPVLLDKVQQALTLRRQKVNNDQAQRDMSARLTTLTKREHEVLHYALEGFCNKKIAKTLDISVRTVEHHRSHILLKTGVDNLLKLSHLINTNHEVLNKNYRY